MRSIIEAGIALRSTADVPRPMVPLLLIRALVYRRLPFTNTSAWSGAKPRRVAGRTWSVPSETAGRGKFNDGAAACSIWAVSTRPVERSSVALMTSTGTGLETIVRSPARDPVTATASSWVVDFSREKFFVTVPPDVTTTVSTLPAYPSMRTRSWYVPG